MNSQPFNPLDLLRIAEFLAERDPSEAGLRTAVSRTYYAVLLTVVDSFGVARGRGIHTRAVGELSKYDGLAGIRLRQLSSLRIIADYELVVRDPFRTDWRYNYRMARASADFVLGRIA